MRLEMCRLRGIVERCCLFANSRELVGCLREFGLHLFEALRNGAEHDLVFFQASDRHFDLLRDDFRRHRQQTKNSWCVVLPQTSCRDRRRRDA
jgi:hypothetical protein